jgi:hypothetical protein
MHGSTPFPGFMDINPIAFLPTFFDGALQEFVIRIKFGKLPLFSGCHRQKKIDLN